MKYAAREDLKVDPDNMFTNERLCELFDLKPVGE